MAMIVQVCAGKGEDIMGKGLKRMSMILAFMLAVSFVPPVAGEGAVAAAEKTVYPLNYSDLFVKSVEIEGNKLTLEGVPRSSEFNYIWFQLEDSIGDTVYENIAGRIGDEAEFAIPTSLNGEYKAIFFTGTDRYGTYTSMLSFDDVRVKNGEATIPDGDIYKNNLSLDSTAPLSAAGIEYYTRPSRDIQSDDASIIQLADSITAGLTDDYSKTLAIHDWVSNEIYYDYDDYYGRKKIGDYSAVGTLNTRRSVCEGYANLTAALLRAEGIPAKKVSGYVFDAYTEDYAPEVNADGSVRTNHAWNEAYADGRWIIIDTTWDSGNNYEYGKVTANEGCKTHRYFDTSQWLIAQDHQLVKAGNYKEMSLYVDYPQYYADGEWKQLTSDGATPVIVNGRTLLPIRPVIEEMGGTVNWVQQSGYIPRVECITAGYFAQMWEGVDKFYVNNDEYTFDVPPQLINGRTMIPIRAVLEKMDCVVTWEANVDGYKGRITIGYAA